MNGNTFIVEFTKEQIKKLDDINKLTGMSYDEIISFLILEKSRLKFKS